MPHNPVISIVGDAFRVGEAGRRHAPPATWFIHSTTLNHWPA